MIQPLYKGEQLREKYVLDEKDQLAIIINILGSPKEEDLEFIQKYSAKNYVRKFKGKNSKDLSIVYKPAGDDALDLLQKMLTFNPKNRKSAKELLKHPLFSKMGLISLENHQKNQLFVSPCDDGENFLDREELLSQISQCVTG